jgi:ferritin
MSRFTDALNEQVANEFGASQQYVAIAVYYDAETLPQLAAFFYRQAIAPVALALALERRVTEQIEGLVRIAREDGDMLGEQFLQWFLKEQLEEISSMAALLRTVERASESNILLVEDYLARTAGEGDAAEVDAPAAAGGAL